MGLSSLILRFVPQQFFSPKITATLLTEEFPPISFHLSVYLFLKQNDIMLGRDAAKTYGAL